MTNKYVLAEKAKAIFSGSKISLNIARLVKIFLPFFSLQVATRFAAFGSGIYLVRMLSKESMAHYSLAFSFQSTVSGIADIAVTSGIWMIGKDFLKERSRQGELLATILSFRRILAIIAIVTLTPVLVMGLRKQGGSWSDSTWLTAITVVAVWIQLSMTVYKTFLQLNGRAVLVQKAEALSAFIRLALLVLVLAWVATASVALLVGLLTIVIPFVWFRKECRIFASPDEHSSSELRRRIVDLFKQLGPVTIFMIFQSNLTIWLATYFGSPASVADLGALLRFNAVFVLFRAFLPNIVLPYLSRAKTAKAYAHGYVSIAAGYFIVCGAILLGGWLTAPWVVSLLGTKYENLVPIFPVFLFGLCLFQIFESLWRINITQGWVRQGYLLIMATVAVISPLLFLIDFSDTRQLVWFNVLIWIPFFFFTLYNAFHGLRTMDDDCGIKP
jgi:O-antigen/teichoic acid export membrane protein